MSRLNRFVATGLVALAGTHANGQCTEPCIAIHTIEGTTQGEQFGWVANPIGDVDGDGVQDFVSTAPTNSSISPNRGRVYVFSGASGAELWRKDGDGIGTWFGYAANGAGDVNSNGTHDVIVGAPFGSVGRVHIFDGLEGTLIKTLNATAPGINFGYDVGGLGDYNGDGVMDIFVGAESFPNPATFTGRVFVYSSSDFSLITTIDGLTTGDHFGSSVEFIGDVNDDGRDDLLVGAYTAGAGTGQMYIYSWNGSASVIVHTLTPPAPAFQAGQWFSNGGDVDGDGVNDAYVSDFNVNRAHVYSGKTGAKLYTFTGDNSGGFGIGRIINDVNDDGHADLVLAAWASNAAAPGGGKAFVYSGKNGKVLETFTHNIANANFGFDAAGMGDVDGDGRHDYLITAASDLAQRGVTYVIAGTISACYADCDNSGTADFFDFLCFQNAFSQPGATAYSADCDGSNTLDFFDFLCFQNRFAAGCQ